MAKTISRTSRRTLSRLAAEAGKEAAQAAFKAGAEVVGFGKSGLIRYNQSNPLPSIEGKQQKAAQKK